MIIVAGGDSFIYGSELKSDQNTFLALVSKNYDYKCAAWPGIGNDGISRRVMNEVVNLASAEPIVIVCWTFPGRYEFKFRYDTGQRTKEWYTITPWTIADVDSIKKEFKSQNGSTIRDQFENLKRARDTGVHEFAEIFYKHVGASEYWEIYTTLKEIVLLQNFLKLSKIPYLFTCADNSIMYNSTINHADQNILNLYNQIDMSNWFWFPAGTKSNETLNPRGFYQWALENKYPTGTTHPLEEAHADAAKLIQEKFNELVKKYME